MRFKHWAALAALATVAIAGCGSDDDNAGSAQTATTPGNGGDRAFVADMIPHHQSAVDMAEIAQERGRSDFAKKLAADIIRTQNAEITTMRGQDRQLAAAGVTKGSLGVSEHMMGTDSDVAKLRTANPFDREFLTMMLPHHQGAVTMAKAEIAKGADPELKQLARNIITAQEGEIRAMRKQLGDGASGMEMESGHSER